MIMGQPGRGCWLAVPPWRGGGVRPRGWPGGRSWHPGDGCGDSASRPGAGRTANAHKSEPRKTLFASGIPAASLGDPDGAADHAGSRPDRRMRPAGRRAVAVSEQRGQQFRGTGVAPRSARASPAVVKQHLHDGPSLVRPTGDRVEQGGVQAGAAGSHVASRRSSVRAWRTAFPSRTGSRTPRQRPGERGDEHGVDRAQAYGRR